MSQENRKRKRTRESLVRIKRRETSKRRRKINQFKENNDVAQEKVVTELIVSHHVALNQKRKHIQQRHRIRCQRKNPNPNKRCKIVTKKLQELGHAQADEADRFYDNMTTATQHHAIETVLPDTKRHDGVRRVVSEKTQSLCDEMTTMRDYTTDQCDELQKEIKKSGLQDFENWVATQGEMMEEANNKGDSKGVHRTVKCLTRKTEKPPTRRRGTMVRLPTEKIQRDDGGTRETEHQHLCSSPECQVATECDSEKRKKRKRKRKLGSQVGKSQRRKKWCQRKTQIKSAVHEVRIKRRIIQAVAAEQGIDERTLRRCVRKSMDQGSGFYIPRQHRENFIKV